MRYFAVSLTEQTRQQEGGEPRVIDVHVCQCVERSAHLPFGVEYTV